MEPEGHKSTPLWHSSQVVRFFLLFLSTGINATVVTNSVTTAEDDTEHSRVFKDGHMIIGGFISNFDNRCFPPNPTMIGFMEAIVYAVEEINNNKSLLPNVTLGYDIRDTCGSEIRAAIHAYDFATATTMNCKAVMCTLHKNCICNVNGTFNTNKPSNIKNFSSTYPVIAIIGVQPSRAAIPLANFLQASRIPYVGAGATSEELSSPIYESYFRTIPSDANRAKAFADMIGHFGWRYVGMIAAEDSYGRTGFEALERESIQRKTFCLELLGYIPLNLINKEKLKAILFSLTWRETIRVVIFWSSSSLAKETLRIAAKEGLKDRVWIFSDWLLMEKTDISSSLAELSSTGIHFGINLQKNISEDFLQHLRRRFRNLSSDADWLWWREFLETVDMNHFSNQSNHISSNTTRLDQLLNKVNNYLAVYIIDAIYSIAHALDQMHKCKSENVLSSTNKDFCPDDKETLETGQLIKYLKNVEFKGGTGKVQFDSRGDPLEANYDIVYFNISEINGIERVTKDVIGSWHKNSKNHLKIHNTLNLWEKDKDGGKIPSSTCTEECRPGQWKEAITECCWKCLPCTDGSVSKNNGALSCTKCPKTQMSNFERTQCIPLPITNIDWSDTLAVILTIISVLGIVIDVSVFGILWYFRDTPIVKALNKVCTLVLLLGIALCFGMTLSYIIRPSSEVCSVLKPLRYVIYTLCCSALFLRTMQIVHAFNISGLKNWVKAFICSTKRQVIVLIAVIGIEVLFGTVWILLDPPYAHEIVFPKSHVFITCVSFKGTPGRVLDSLMLVYLLLVAGCCIFYAFRARNLRANFNEARHISFSLYIFLLSWITYYPVAYAVEGWYVAVLSGATLLLSSYGLLSCTLAPTFFILIWHPEKNTAEFIRAVICLNNVKQTPCYNSNAVRPADA